MKAPHLILILLFKAAFFLTVAFADGNVDTDTDANSDSDAEGAQIVVVTKNQSIEELSKKQLKQIYLEGGLNIPLKAINLQPGNKYRSIFNAKIIGLTESRLQAYWAQMEFTGRAARPMEIVEIGELLEFLESNPDHIAYVPAGVNLPPSLRVVFSLDY